MKNDRGIKLLMEDMRDEPVYPLDAAGIENEEIDKLLRLVADERTAEIDFEAIKQRAVTAAKAKKQKRGRLRRAASYAMFACASLVLGITLFSVLKDVKKPQGGTDVTALATPGHGSESSPDSQKTPYEQKGSADGLPVWRMDAGAVSNDTYKDISKKVSDLFPEALPERMMKLIDEADAHVSAIGTDRNGEEISYDLVMSAEPPIELETGEACSVADGSYIVYYWQMSEDNCIAICFTGFEQSKADSMFNSLAKRIIQIAPNNGQR